MKKLHALSALGLALLCGCDHRSTEIPEPRRESPAAVASSSDEVPRPATGASETTVSGKVVEKLDVPSYTYLLLDTGSDKVWAAVPSSGVAVGAKVSVEKAMLMRGYRSTALKRDFDRVYFGVLAAGTAPVAAHGAASALAPAVELPANIQRAPGKGSKTVAEVIGQASKLAGREVAIRGVVVKSNAGILGRTWIHLRDGSGNEHDKTNDLTVTLPQDETPKPGDMVVVYGKVAINRDVGAGYKFAVLLEGERLERDQSAKR